jgi:cytochrome oxidase Cu insertion factor (SCO1/SenC/PrrC family)
VPAASGYEVEHTAPVHLIDRTGRVRVVFGSTFRPAQLTHDIEALLKE